MEKFKADILISELREFSNQLQEFESEIKHISSDSHAQHFIPPRISNALLENYKKRVEALEITLQELRAAINEECTKSELSVNQLEERLRIAKECVYFQVESNNKMEEVRSKRAPQSTNLKSNGNQINSASFFKKAAVITGMGLVAVGVLRVLGA